MKKVLVLCTGNSCRSQIAEGFFKALAGDKALVYSAGIDPHGVNPKAVKVMAEKNIDISNHTSDSIDKYRDIDFDFVITVCDNAKEKCPYFLSNAKKINHSFPDPAKAVGTEEEILNNFRKVRDMIQDFVQKFIKDNLTD